MNDCISVLRSQAEACNHYLNVLTCSESQLLGVAKHLFNVLSRGLQVRVLDDSEMKVLSALDLFYMGLSDIKTLRSSLVDYYEI